MTTSISALLILGAGGDLSSRLLLPALGQLLTVQPHRRIRLVGAGREAFSPDEWRAFLGRSFAQGAAAGPAVEHVLSSAVYHQVDVTERSALQLLLAECEGTAAVYFALPPAITVRVCDSLAGMSLPPGTALALEKPFGTDEHSAHALNEQLARLVPEDRVHRVDHFLGRSTVFNLIGLRFANRIFEPLWNNTHIERIDIVYDEQLGLEGRAGYYDQAGALVDMIQSHLLQVLAVLAMEPPPTLAAADLRDGKGLVLRATRPWGGDPASASRRARYTAGAVGERSLPAYADEAGVNPERRTETLAEVCVEVDNWRWAGVPFTLRSGKALSARRREVIITFKPVPHLPTGLLGQEAPAVLRIFLAPDEMSLELNINGPGDPHVLDRASLDATFGAGQLPPYGEVLEGLLDGNPSLSVRGDAAEECWRIVAPVLEAWRTDAVPLAEYAAGSPGPSGWSRLG